MTDNETAPALWPTAHQAILAGQSPAIPGQADESDQLTNWDKEHARQWLYAHNGDEGGGLGGLWEMVAEIVARHGRMIAQHQREWEAAVLRRCVETMPASGEAPGFIHTVTTAMLALRPPPAPTSEQP